MGTYIYRLKGGVSISIAGDGLVTKTATWMVIASGGSSGASTYSTWKALEVDAMAWAGNVGDGWKEPVQDSTGRECSTYTASTLFRVTSIEVVCVDRLLYEVTFSAQQNLSTMKLIGNIDVSIDNINQKTMVLNYQVDVATGAYSEVAALFHTPGSELVIFTGSVCLIDNISYTHQSKTRYAVTINLRDMSVMMLGRPKFSIDAHEQKVASVGWRYSYTAYSTLTLPTPGQDASVWLGLTGSDYVVSGVNSEPDGLLGYTVSIDAKHVSNTHVKTDQSFELNTDYAFDSEAAVEHSASVTRQCTADGRADYEGMIGQEATEFGFPNMTISSVAINETGRGDYEAVLSLTDDEYKASPRMMFQNSQNYLKNQIDLSINYSEIVLEAKHLGYVRGLSDIDWVAINNPPKTLFAYDLDVKGIQAMNPTKWTDAAIKAGIIAGKLGYSFVFKVYDLNNRPMTKAAIQALDSVDSVSSVRLQDYVYAQPTQVVDGMSLRNIYFTPWKAKDSAIIYDSKSDRTDYPTTDGLDDPMKKSRIGMVIPVVECTIGMHYKGKASTVIARWEHRFFSDASSEINLKGVTSYKRTNLSMGEVTDNKGKIWTKVTQTLAGLMGYYWNHDYSEGSLR